MLCTWLILFHLLKLGYSNDEDIEVCVKEVGEPKKKRPTVDPSHCYDAKPEVCIALFKKQDQTFANNPKP
ncbi:unnamed protein product [Dracunculus medinensis]|uniref:Secreted protein n=1 Tax=Dracunculus medinensis TaxID=318479 RepID=A0A0N4UNG1_DRAME|nr:unnamed protein product [Dracunculus medinensis]